ncbi:MAG: UDP-N-acetylmuramoyl-L-alanine--D-glutamate ligase [Actinomycetota bacterium]
MNVLVLGAAVSGVSAAHLASRLGHEVAIYDRSSKATIALRDKGYRVHSGTWVDHLLNGIDLVVASPGFPEGSDPIQAALRSGIEIISELEFGTRQLTVPYVAITGTNGKTTVTNAISDMLNASGVSAVAAGNIGTPICDLGEAPASIVVLEASSFQLRFIDRFRPLAAGIINVAADHLDWHGTVAAYAAAKARIFENMDRNDTLAFDTDDDGATRLAEQAPCRIVPVSGRAVPAGGVGRNGTGLALGGQVLPLSTTDPSWVVDLAIAAVVASAAGATAEGIASVAEAFAAGPHRRRTVSTKDGVTWVDDSKATNPHAARAAAAAYPSVVLLAGGRNKDLDLSTIAPDTVRHVVAFGEAAESVAGSVDRPVTVVGGLAEAVEEAERLALPGDTVLLAPGCASFDEFDSYAARGERFADLVQGVGAAK